MTANNTAVGTTTDWVDFRGVKAAVTFTQVLTHYEINWLRQSGQELRGQCPLHRGADTRTFHVNVAKQAFNCFSCRKRGNVLDFVAAMENCTVRDAALKLRDWFLATPPPQATTAQTTVVQPAAGKSRALSPESERVNPPLKFQLRVDHEHEYGSQLGFSKSTLAAFGAGVCISKGMFAGRFVIPLHDEQGRLIGYVGRSIADTASLAQFPAPEKGFSKQQLLFNLHRVIKVAGANEPIIVTPDIGTTMLITQVGLPCVGLLGESVAAAQAELLAAHFNQVQLLWERRAANQLSLHDCVMLLAQRMFVSYKELPPHATAAWFTKGNLAALLREEVSE